MKLFVFQNHTLCLAVTKILINNLNHKEMLILDLKKIKLTSQVLSSKGVELRNVGDE